MYLYHFTLTGEICQGAGGQSCFTADESRPFAKKINSTVPKKAVRNCGKNGINIFRIHRKTSGLIRETIEKNALRILRRMHFFRISAGKPEGVTIKSKLKSVLGMEHRFMYRVLKSAG